MPYTLLYRMWYHSPAILLIPFTSVGRCGWSSFTGSFSILPYCPRVPAKTIFTAGLFFLHASRMESWLRQLMSRSVYGSRIESMWLTWPARLKMKSLPRTRWSIELSSRTSAILTRTLSSMPEMLNRLPPYCGISESTSVSSAQCPASAWARLLPMNPSPPVIRTRLPRNAERSSTADISCCARGALPDCSCLKWPALREGYLHMQLAVPEGSRLWCGFAHGQAAKPPVDHDGCDCRPAPQATGKARPDGWLSNQVPAAR